jgi:hypothetical protein
MRRFFWCFGTSVEKLDLNKNILTLYLEEHIQIIYQNDLPTLFSLHLGLDSFTITYGVR